MQIILDYIEAADPAVRTLPDSVYTIWWTVLLVIAIVVVPLAIVLLHRTLSAALSIRRYLKEMLEAGVDIAENTSSIPALKDTIAVGTDMVETSGRLNSNTSTIKELLAARAQGRA